MASMISINDISWYTTNSIWRVLYYWCTFVLKYVDDSTLMINSTEGLTQDKMKRLWFQMYIGIGNRIENRRWFLIPFYNYFMLLKSK